MTFAASTETAIFVSRGTAAARLEISPDTFDDWVRDGLVPPASITRGSIRRWHWPSVEARLTAINNEVSPQSEAKPQKQHRGKYPEGVFRTRKPNGTEYWYYQRDKGKPTKGPLVRLPDFGSPEFYEALRLVDGSRHEGAHQRNDMTALVARYRTTASWRKQRPATTATYECAFTPILEHWGEREPGEITVAQVIDLINKFANKPSMGNMVLVMVKKLMKYAVQRGLRSDNPAREVDPLDEDTDGAKPLTPAAWAALMAPECPTSVHRLAVLGRATGQRISDLIRMRPADRDEDGISCTITKLHDKPHWCILKPEEAAEIDGWLKADGWRAGPMDPYLRRPDRRPHTTDSLRLAWTEYAATLTGAPLAGFTPHDLRATKVCDERISRKTHQQIAAMVGMSVGMVMKYSKHIDQRLAARGST